MKTPIKKSIKRVIIKSIKSGGATSPPVDPPAVTGDYVWSITPTWNK